jgi:hypothetical protein
MAYRPMLRPGAAVLRRDAAHLQVGTSPGTVLADRPGLHRLLLALDGLHGPDWLAEQVPEIGVHVADVLARLTAAGVVLDAAACGGRRPEEARRLALIGRDPVLAAKRRHFRVALHPDPGARALLGTVGEIVSAAGVDVRTDGDVDLLVVASCGEPARGAFAETVADGLPHLVVRVEEAVVRVGPFVLPGSTSCLGCQDLHRVDWDPGWAAVLPQLGRRAAQHNPPATGAVLRHAAAVAIAADVVAVADGERPLHAGAEVTMGPLHADRRVDPAPFHHRCTCALLPSVAGTTPVS